MLPAAAAITAQRNAENVKNVAANRDAGSIMGAQFLQRFIQGGPWAHLDIAAVNDFSSTKPYADKGASGIPVRTAVDASAVKPDNIGKPGEYPFTRGIFPDGYQGRLWTIRQYSGFGTGLFDLANLSANGAYDAAADAVLLDAYFEGRVTDDLRRSFAAMKAASALREALWAMVSEVHLKTPGVDYRAHAAEYLKRLDRLLQALA